MDNSRRAVTEDRYSEMVTPCLQFVSLKMLDLLQEAICKWVRDQSRANQLVGIFIKSLTARA